MISNYFNVNIEIYRNSGSIDSDFVYSETGSLYASFMGNMQTLKGDEQYVNDKQESVKTYRIFTEHLTSSLAEKDILTISGKDYDIVLVDDLLQNDHVEIDVIGKT